MSMILHFPNVCKVHSNGARKPFTKATKEQERLERLLRKQELRVQRAFSAFLADVRNDDVLKEVRLLLQGNRIEDALRIVDSHVLRLANVFPKIFVDVAENETEHLANKVFPPRSRLGIAFDPTHARAAELMRKNRLQFVRGFRRQQRDATRSALAQALREGGGPREAAREFVDSIGLTRRQLDHVTSYRQLLMSNTPSGLSRALSRDIRDRRFDGTIERAIESGEKLTRAQVDKMVARYRRRYVQYRSEVIARTETHKVLNEARQESLEQMVEDVGISQSDVVRVWQTNLDGRERPTHHEMNGQERGLKEAFRSPSGARLMFPGDPNGPAAEVIQCRCTVTIDFKQ